MLFTDPIFALFFLIVFAVRWLLRRYTHQKLFLLAANALFYGAWDYRFLFLMGGYIVVNHVIALRIHATDDPLMRKRWLIACVVSNLAVLGFFKYFNFFVSSGVSLLTLLGVETTASTLEIILPVGISFITFQAMSYVIDVYRRELEPASFLDFALFKSFFPQLVAGPIVRASYFLPQLQAQPRLAQVDFRWCLGLFLLGYFKKVCIADNIARVIDPVFADPSAHSGRDVLLASGGYSIQIYCDFSGYSEMAIACAGLLGYQLARNFDAPYLSTDIQDFWRRWHISLSTWLRDYLYIPLGGGRNGTFATYRNLLITMVLGGLWHGANMTFVLWGLAHGVALGVHRALSSRLKRLTASAPSPVRAGWNVLAWACTLAWVVACFTLFRCDSLTTFIELCNQLSVAAKPVLHHFFGPFLLALLIAHAALYFTRPFFVRASERVPAPVFAFGLGLGVALALFFTPLATSPFLYFQF
jgi:alginate O-acetyltransferase complex protein AlgI